MENLNYLIVGLGLIGGSIAKGLAKKKHKVYAIDINEDSIKYAKKEKIILNDNESNEELIRNSDIIIICLYPSMVVKWVKDNKHLFKENVLITDVTGIKKEIVNLSWFIILLEKELSSRYLMVMVCLIIVNSISIEIFVLTIKMVILHLQNFMGLIRMIKL